MLSYTDIELYMHKDRIEVFYKSQHYASIAIREGNQMVISFSEQKQNEIELTCGSLSNESDLLSLDIFTLVTEVIQEVALPRSVRIKREPVKTTVISPGRVVAKRDGGNDPSPDHIAEGQRDSVLTSILDSMLDTPNQSKAFRVEETKRIAARFDEPIMAVAGVRANLTRGSYGDVDNLLTKRRRARARAARV